jgi:mRNA interferase RelE/StbE
VSYDVAYPRRVDKQLASLPAEASEALRLAFEKYASDPLTREVDVLKIKGHSNRYRIRCGNYRLIFQLNKREKVLEALQAQDRKDAY